MQRSLPASAYPKALPEPTLRKGSLTYEIRVRVPPAAKGGRFKGSHTSRSLGTRDKAEALRRLPLVYDDLQAEFDAEAARLDGKPSTASVVEAVDCLPVLTVDDACIRYRDFILQGEQKNREERVQGAKNSRSFQPVILATEFRKNLDRSLEDARARAIVHDYSHCEWFLAGLEREGIGTVDDRRAALAAMARTKVQTLRKLIDDDEALAPFALPPPATLIGAAVPNQGGVPSLSKFVETHIAKRGSSLSEERADTIRATVRDLIAIAGDKPIDAYTAANAEAFEEVMRRLPGNWNKRSSLRRLSIRDAATFAAAADLAPQAASNIKKKWTVLYGVFKQAAVKHPLRNPFVAEALVIDDGRPANAGKDTYTPEELQALLTSPLPERLKWLTWLGLYTGARLNELCQLTKQLIRNHNGLHYIYFSPELRLKTGGRQSCIRAVPIHDTLIAEGFLDYVARADGLLFPGIPQHKSGRNSDAPSKAFTRHLKNIGIKRDKLSFHSLRHTFTAALKRHAPRDPESRERLLGHTYPGLAARYGDSYEAEAHDMILLAERAKVLRLVKFEGRNDHIAD